MDEIKSCLQVITNPKDAKPGEFRETLARLDILLAPGKREYPSPPASFFGKEKLPKGGDLDRGGISREGNLWAMSRRDRGERKISTDSDLGFGSNPFSSLDGSGLPEALPESTKEVKVTVEDRGAKLRQWRTIRDKAGEIR